MRSRGLALLATASVVAIIAGTATSAVGRPAMPPRSAPPPIGYVYASTISAIDILAVQPNLSLKKIGSVTTQDVHVLGLAILHTPGGVHLYALETISGAFGFIYEYSVHTSTGRLTPDKTKPVAAVEGSTDNGLLAYDGYAVNKSYKSELFSRSICAAGPCTSGQTGFAQFTVNPNTGEPHLVAPATNQDIYDMSSNGNEIDLVLQAPQGGAKVVALEVVPKTGHLVGGSPFTLTYSSKLTPAFANVSATEPDRVGLGNLTIAPDTAGAGVYGSSGTTLTNGGGTEEASSASQITSLTFTRHLLLAGETLKSNGGPQLEVFSPDGAGSEGVVNLTDKPYGLATGNNFPITMFTLGDGIYIGLYDGPVVQATEGVGGKGLAISKTHPTVAGTFQAYAITGYLFPHKSKTLTTIHVKISGGKVHVSGAVAAGVAGVKVTVDLERRSGGTFHTLHTTKAKLSAGKKYAAALAPVKAGQCRAVARYPGTSTTAASSASKSFTC